MTALNVFVTESAAHIITDGAGCAGTRLLTYAPKTLALPHLSCAAGFRGNLGVIQQLRFQLSLYASYNEMALHLPADLRRRWKWRCRILPRIFNFDLAIAAFHQGKPSAFLLSSVERPGAPAFEPLAIEYFWGAPQIEADHLRQYAAAMSGNLDGPAFSLLDEQRRNGDVVIGGYGQITSIGPRGIDTRLLGRWNDKRGESIDRDIPPTTFAGTSSTATVTDWRNG
ncbi:hypothetical protein [Ensifer adhaerens]|uniref:hypothetical protein n=1 Tax=Ensifer adhaerens TaxID=106592 RepID=UPI000FDADF4B|nr:hypothetical protein [Ensifer adhaerens]MDF8353218.1 hypothetical protein [Ensifer adhaerens]THA67980.1 hypothetical protein E5176_07545 [Ensifer adhaerens]